MPQEQKPSVGRIVHYGQPVSHFGSLTHPEPWAAIITAVNRDETVCLQVFGLIGVTPREQVSYSEELKEGFWTWPPRVG